MSEEFDKRALEFLETGRISIDAHRDWVHVTSSATPDLGHQSGLAARLRQCPVVPSETHCWHEPYGYWPGPLPPPLVCCWCAAETDDPGAVPRRHGPHCPED